LLPVVENEDPEDAKIEKETSNAYSIFHNKSELING